MAPASAAALKDYGKSLYQSAPGFVGTKLLLPRSFSTVSNTVGEDLVAMCVDDIVPMALELLCSSWITKLWASLKLRL